MYKSCFIIPSYQHSSTLEQIIQGLAPFKNKIFVVNDGSAEEHRQVMLDLEKKYDLMEVIHHSVNQGKGAACSTGLVAAHKQGYTHGIQIDSDGQHDLGKVAELIELSKKYPEDLISGRPVYDESVPKSRLYGRYATHIWVWIETLSLEIIDSMCGFRSYPLKSTVAVVNGKKIGQRMDFDSEVMVRLFWKGTKVRFLPVPVIYPENGISHFDVLHDNIRISKMHTRLFFGMIPRIPILLWRKIFPKTENQPWHKIQELGPELGIKILLLFYKFTGRRFFNLVLMPVVYYYSLFARSAVKASNDYQARIQKFSGGKIKSFSSFRHIYSFASTAIDKFAVWMGDIKYSDLNPEDVQKLLKIADSQQGAFFITSHYGNIEVCRALGRFSHVHFNALVYYENAKKFNAFLSRISPESNLNLISVKDAGPELAIALKEKIDNKEWIFVMGDRQSINTQTSQRSLEVSLLGEPADIPEGPFLLAYLLDVPVFTIHCFRQGKGFRIDVHPISSTLPRGRENRSAIIQDMAKQYAARLEQTILQDPVQWYNFFPFWRSKN